MRKIITFIILIIVLFSCDIQYKEPEFKRIENIFVEKISDKNITITSDVVFFNPNNVSAFLTGAELDVIANEVKVSHISQTTNIEISKQSEFKAPVKANFKPSELVKDKSSIIDLISGGLEYFKNKTIDIKYVGTLQFKVAGIKFNVPLEFEEKVKVK